VSQPALTVENLGKRYRIGRQVEAAPTWRAALGNALKAHWLRLRMLGEGGPGDETLWALREASFTVPPGQVVGIIGRNGAGKSTLLKILSRVVVPTTGRAVIAGRVGSLLEVGTGFHPDLTGRENIFLNGAILGLRRAEIRRVFDDIVAFAELERFLDTPVKRYSSGMYVRLAFAVAAHLEPEILLVDEVLAVGDIQFQKKCLGQMSEVAKSGRTILFVSHNMAAIEGLCQRGLVLDGGRIVFDGPIAGALDHYLVTTQKIAACPLRDRADRGGNGRLRFTALRFVGPAGPTNAFRTGQTFRAEVDYEAAGELKHVSLSVPFFTRIGQPAFMAWTRLLDSDFERLPPQGTLVLEIPRLPLRGGAYSINLHSEVNGHLADWVKDAARFDVHDGDYFGTGKTPPPAYGLVVVEHRFHYEDACVPV
jgi:lipopolysaccharide transport system ATP-binding protein